MHKARIPEVSPHFGADDPYDKLKRALRADIDEAAWASVARLRPHTRYRRDRDSAALDRAMARLDTEEAEARRPGDVGGVPAEVAVRYLRELATTWRTAHGGPGRRMLAEALFERIEAKGLREITLQLTDAAIAHGFGSAIPARSEVIVGYGRGERSSAHTFQLTVWIDAGDSTPLRLVRSA